MPDIREPNLQLPVGWNSGEAGWGGSYNFAMGLLGATSHLEVVSSTENAPPPSPADGVRYLIPDSPAATGDWAGQEGDIAVYRNSDSAWTFYTPRKGMRAFVEDTDELIRFDGTAWQTMEFGESTFFGLTDTPSGGTAGQTLVLNAGEDALEFANFPTAGATSFLELDDTFSAYTGLGDQLLVVNDTEDGVATITVASLNIPTNVPSDIQDLTGVPSFTGQTGKMLVINSAEDALEVQDVPTGGGGGGGGITAPGTTVVNRIPVFDSTNGGSIGQGFASLTADTFGSNDIDARKNLKDFTFKNNTVPVYFDPAVYTTNDTMTVNLNDSDEIFYPYFDISNGDDINISFTNAMSDRFMGASTPERAVSKIFCIELPSGTFNLNVTQDGAGLLWADGTVSQIVVPSGGGLYILMFLCFGAIVAFDCGVAV